MLITGKRNCWGLVMPVVRDGKTRLLRYPALLSQCILESSVYAKCVLSLKDVKHNSCEKEFQILKRCVQSRAREAGIRL
ncbi:unnamed protein product [Schistosoma haematobium]|nr:unnamed protein product [Schistosoma haematobium]